MYGELEWMKVKSLARQGYGFKPIGRELGDRWEVPLYKIQGPSKNAWIV
jgi:hypothetical protein